MGAERRRFRQRPLYNAAGSWAAKPAAASVPDGYRYMLDGSDGWGAYQVWIAVLGYWYPQGGFCVLYDYGDLWSQNLTYASTSLGKLAGFTTVSFPLAYLASVPGAFFRSVVKINRASPANTQQFNVRLRWSELGDFNFLQAAASAAAAELVVSGETTYAPTAGKHIVTGNTMPAWGASNNAYSQGEQNIADSPLSLFLATGGAGETMRLRTVRVEYHAGAY